MINTQPLLGQFFRRQGWTKVTASYILTVYEAGTPVPLTGLLGLGLLAGACAVGGASVLRRKKLEGARPEITIY